ncbi:MAG: Omp28-related outer membrane protein [Flavobacteriales bacterium]|nr:Omp28-related outer membrane protein [Flavobacteriales bacterium]
MDTRTTLFPLPLFAALAIHAQSLVSTEPMPRTALLEEFTAAGCGNCPAAHVVANDLATVHGDDLMIIGIHGGGLAAPQAGQPDFRTPDGTALWSAFAVPFQPIGMVNRQGLQQASGWMAAVSTVLSEISPVNIGVASSFDAGTQTLTVDVELYYTGEGPVGDDAIHVALTQDGIVARQQDYQNGVQQNYMHRHVLRDLLTPVQGDPVSTTAIGSFVQRTYSLPVPSGWTLADLDVVAFVSEGAAGVVHQARQVDADGGITTTVDGTAGALGLGNVYPMPAHDLVTFTFTDEAAGRVLILRDGLGRIVMQEQVNAYGANVVISVGGLAAGLYHAGLDGGRTKKVLVSH